MNESIIQMPESRFRYYKRLEAEHPRLHEAILEERIRANQIERKCESCTWEERFMWGMAGIIIGIVLYEARP